MAIFGLVMIGMMILPALFASSAPKLNLGLIETYGPFVLLAYTLFLLFSSVGEQAINFSPSEVDFLFPAPFTRRQLLTYRLVNNVVSTFVVSLFIGLMNRMLYSNTLAGLMGIFLAFTFLSLLATFTGLVGQTVSARAFTRSRQLIGVVLIGFLAYALSSALVQWEGASVQQVPELMESTLAGRVVLAPFRVFCNAITATQIFPDFIVSATIGIAMICALVAGIFWVDADFNETAIRVAQQKLDRLKKFQQGDFTASKKGKLHSTRIGMLPYWAGSGPLVWRQLVRAQRQSKTVLRILAMFAVFASIPIYRNLVGKEPDPKLPLYVFGWLSYFTMIFAGSAPVGFRVDIDRMEVLKGLPTNPTAVVLGQIAGATLLLSTAHWLVILLMAILLPSGWAYWLTGAVLCVPINCMLMTVTNGLFLLMPIRFAAASQDPQVVFKNMFTAIMQFLIYGIVVAITAAPAAIAYFVSNSVGLAILAGLAMLAIANFLGLVFVRYAFVRFDVTRHSPVS